MRHLFSKRAKSTSESNQSISLTNPVSNGKSCRILVCSDSHGMTEWIQQAIDREKPIDLLIHCGDAEENLENAFPGRTFGLVQVAGNNDWDRNLRSIALVDVLDKKILVTHGHLYGARRGTDQLAALGRQQKADIVLYGHTHLPHEETTSDGMLILNPGSIAIPYQTPRKKTYVILTLTTGKAPEVRYHSLP